MFMRVWRTLPQFTFILSERFVNHKSLVSTGFFGFFPVLFGFGHFFTQKTQQNDENFISSPFCLVHILPQRQVRNIFLSVPEELILRVERSREKLRLPAPRASKD